MRIIDDIKAFVTAGKFAEVESAWMQVVEGAVAQAPTAADASLPVSAQPPTIEELAAVLETLGAAGQGALAEMLGWTLLVKLAERLAPEAALAAGQALVAAVPESKELRNETAALYRRVFGVRPHFELLLQTTGLLAGAAPRRAFRALETCLAIEPGTYLTNRFEHQVLRVTGFDEAAREYEATDAAGRLHRLAARTLADDYDLAEASDFRVLVSHRPEEVAKLLEDDPAAILVGLCLTHGGSIDAVALKDVLVPRFLEAEKWSGWWNRARTAAKRSPQLTLEGRAPVTVVYHAGGRTLEEELAPAAAAAKMPLEHLAVLRQYVREARARKSPVQPAFAGPIVAALRGQVRAFCAERPHDAFAARLALEAAQELLGGTAFPGCAEDAQPGKAVPLLSPQEIIAGLPRPAEAVAGLVETELADRALALLCARPDAATQLEALLRRTPADVLDKVAAALLAAGGGSALAATVNQALAEPRTYLELFLWLYRGPEIGGPGQRAVSQAMLPEQGEHGHANGSVAMPPGSAAMPPGSAALPPLSKVDLLTRLLTAVHEVDLDWELPAPERKALLHRFRAALAASDYAAFRQAIKEMDLPVAGTIKRRVERLDGLALTVRHDLMEILRENFYSLFVKAKVEPWQDENTIWTSQAALDKRQAELKHLVEVKMLENARAIGAAAEHGDLSENSEWKFAIEERDLLAARVLKLRQELALARVIQPEDVPADSVGIGSRVHLRRVDDGQELTMSFMGMWDGIVEQNIYSYKTALAAELMGKGVGEEIAVKLEGFQGRYRIEKLGSAL